MPRSRPGTMAELNALPIRTISMGVRASQSKMVLRGISTERATQRN
jgi:hypothetical protein